VGIFGFVQRKVEEKVLDDIFEEMLLTSWVLLRYKPFECHAKSGRRHKAVGAFIEEGKGVYFHFCDAVGYATLDVKGEEPEWHEVPWLTADVKQSTAVMLEFLGTLR
jgi:hypothetical protein